MAVLPLRVVGDSDVEYLASGFTESLSARLSEWDDISLASEASARTIEIDQIGTEGKRIARDLGVSLLLTGTFQVQQNSVHIVLSLMDAGTEKPPRTYQISGARQNIFQFENKLYSDLLGSLKPAKHRSFEEGLLDHDSRAIDLYLRGREIMRDRPDQAEEAIGLYKAALEIDSNFALARAKKADAEYIMYRTYSPNTRKWIEAANDDATKALESGKNIPQVHLALANAYSQLGEYDRAEKAAIEAVTQRPNWDEAYRVLGRVYLAKNQYVNAIESFQRALSANQYYWNNASQLGTAYATSGEYKDAFCAHREVTQLAPNRWDGYAGLAEVYFELGEFEQSAIQAQKALTQARNISTEKAIKYRPPPPGVLAMLGLPLFYLGDYANAATVWESAVVNHGDEKAIANLADAYREMHDPRATSMYLKAQQLIETKIAEDRSSEDLVISLALALAKTGNLSMAETKISSLKALSALNDPESLYDWAVVLALIHKPDEALTVLDTALRKGAMARRAKAEPDFGELRNDPRFSREFEDLMRRYGTPRVISPSACDDGEWRGARSGLLTRWKTKVMSAVRAH